MFVEDAVYLTAPKVSQSTKKKRSVRNTDMVWQHRVKKVFVFNDDEDYDWAGLANCELFTDRDVEVSMDTGEVAATSLSMVDIFTLVEGDAVTADFHGQESLAYISRNDTQNASVLVYWDDKTVECSDLPYACIRCLRPEIA